MSKVLERISVDARKKMIDHNTRMVGSSNRPRNMKYFDDIALLAAEKLYDARTLTEAKASSKVIGFFCPFVPEELIYASGAVPIRMDAGLSGTIELGEEALPGVLCPLIKSLLGLLVTRHEKPDLLIVPTVCDGKKKMCEILSEYSPTWVLGIPHTTDSVHAKKFFMTEVRNLKEKLEEFTGQKITKKKLKQAIEIYNKRREAVRRLYETRKASIPPIWGRDVLSVITNSFFDIPKRWILETEKLCQELEENVQKGIGVCEADSPRIMLAGAPIIPPNWKVLDLIEESGAIIVCDELCSGARGLWYLVESGEDTVDAMCDALAQRNLMCKCACFTPNNARIDRIVKNIKDYNVNGLVYHGLFACLTFNVEARQVEEALKKLGIPILYIETGYGVEDTEPLRTRIEAFLEMIHKTTK